MTIRLLPAIEIYTIIMVAIQFPRVGVCLMWGIVKKICLRDGSFALSIVQIPTYAREGWGRALH